MKRFSTAPARFAAGLVMVLAIVSLPSLASAQVLTSQNTTANVTITDSGISPASVTIPVGGSVTWTNKGNRTHTADSTGGPSAFNTAGIGPGSSATLVFTVPGLYAYTSGADCLHGVYFETFTCGNYTVAVLANGALPSPVVTPTPTPVAPAQAGPLPAASVTIGDTAFSPAMVEIALNSNVTFTNNGTRVHSATETPDTATQGLPFFDRGSPRPSASPSRARMSTTPRPTASIRATRRASTAATTPSW
jgi:plastocyanin